MSRVQQHDHHQLRPARLADNDELFRMAGLLATSAVPQRESFERVLAAILDDSEQRIVVAEAATGLAGYLHGLVHPVFHVNGYIGWVEELFVDPDHRGTGLGRALMEDFESWARRSVDARYIAVATRRADAFYRSIGYVPSATYFKKSFS
jgi:GNAT superfamily N-acetyltransferase